jgi:hypothetical protein
VNTSLTWHGSAVGRRTRSRSALAAEGPPSWEALFWVPLMAGGGDPAAIARWKERALAIEDRRRRGDLATIALVFAELAGRYAAWEKGLEGFDMTESKVVNRWIEQALEKDRLENARRLMIRILNHKFPGQVAPDVVQTINSQPSLSLLEDWFEQASQVTSIEDFVRVLRK